MSGSVNPLVALGTLNRLRGAVVVTNFTALNVTASYLGKNGISLALEGNATEMINVMTGMVTAPEPYMPATISIHLLRTQGLSAAWRAQLEAQSTIGNVQVHSDASTFPEYTFQNCAIRTIREMPFDGSDPGFVITITGTYVINNSLWSLL